MTTIQPETIDDPILEPEGEGRTLSEREMRITKLHFIMVTRYILEGGPFLNESELLKVDPITKAIARNEIRYAQGSQPTSAYDTDAEINAQLDLLYDVVLKVAPKAKTPIARPQRVARKVRPSM